VNCLLSCFTYPKSCRQLLTFRFLPYLLESHAILRIFSVGEDTSLNDTDVFEGRSSSGDAIGAFVRPSPSWEGRSTLSERAAAAQSDTHNTGNNNMLSRSGKEATPTCVLLLILEGTGFFASTEIFAARTKTSKAVSALMHSNHLTRSTCQVLICEKNRFTS